MSCRRVVIATGIYPPDIGGSATFAQSLVDGLRLHNIEAVPVNFSPLLTRPWGLRHLIYFRQLLEQGRGSEALLALDPVSVGVPALFACRLLRLPFLLRVGGDYAWEQATQRFGVSDDLQHFQSSRYGWRVGLLRWTERRVARAAVMVIVPSRFMRSMVERWGVDQDRMVVIENAFDGQDAAGLPPTRQEARTQLGLSGRLIVSAGRLLRLKGFNVLIESIGHLRPEFPDIRLVILGSGPQSAELMAVVREARLEGVVQLVGAVSRREALLYLRAADLFVLNSASEGMANVVVEAMAVGTPVAASNIGGNPELIDHGRSGWLFGHDNGTELEAAVRTLLRNPALAAGLAEAAGRAPDRFDTRRMVLQTIHVLDSVIGDRSAR